VGTSGVAGVVLRALFLLLAAGVVAVATGSATATATATVPSAMASGLRGREVGCTADAAEALVRHFVGSFNRGHVAAANRLWALEPYFQWYSTSGAGRRLGTRAYDRSTLASYFAGRARAHEKIRLTELVAGVDPKRNIVNFSGKLVRIADDVRPTDPHPFKGAATCRPSGRSLIVWSM
jgi:hypothetical protein